MHKPHLCTAAVVLFAASLSSKTAKAHRQGRGRLRVFRLTQHTQLESVMCGDGACDFNLI